MSVLRQSYLMLFRFIYLHTQIFGYINGAYLLNCTMRIPYRLAVGQYWLFRQNYNQLIQQYIAVNCRRWKSCLFRNNMENLFIISEGEWRLQKIRTVIHELSLCLVTQNLIFNIEFELISEAAQNTENP